MEEDRIQGDRELRRAREELERRLTNIRRREARAGRGSGLRVEPDLAEVAKVYVEASRLAMPAADRIAWAWRVSRPTVTRWLQRARAQELLPKEG